VTETLLRTPLRDLHLSLGARMAPFAGYEMPVQYPAGIIAEHQWTRGNAGFFDVSHMGQAFLTGPDHATTVAALEALVPGDIAGLDLGRMRYTQLLNEKGGIIDDLMVTRSSSADDDGALGLVVNAGRKSIDYAWIESHLPPKVKLVRAEDRALIALQGPKAAEVLARHARKAAALAFMSGTSAEFDGIDCHVSRSGYTGEDGFEISVVSSRARGLAQALLAEPEVKPVGLGARDSLRLEAGLCLYGHDLDETTSPVEAGLVWSIGKRRRSEGGFIGAERVLRELKDGANRKRVGIRPEGRGPAREGTEIFTPAGSRIGFVTSGLFGSTLGGPISMGYVDAAFAVPETAVTLIVRDKPIAARIVPLPFVPHRYKR
jgi:aminomethyltransferase